MLKINRFQEIDFENKELWNDYNKQDLLSQLRDENVVQYTCELYIESETQSFWQRSHDRGCLPNWLVDSANRPYRVLVAGRINKTKINYKN